MSVPDFVAHRVVAFSETDAAGIVHFSNFLRYAEDAEHAWLRSLGVALHGEGALGLPRVEVACTYRRPLRFGDEVEVALTVQERRRRSLRYRFEVRRGGEVAAEGAVTVVATRVGGDGVLEAVPLPEALRGGRG